MNLYLQLLQNDPRVTIDHTQPGVSRMVIDDVRRSDASVYKCTARSVAGTDSKNGTLTAECKYIRVYVK